MLTMLNALRTEFYISDAGYLCIKQYDYPENDITIILSREQALIFKDHFDELLKEQDQKWDGLEHAQGEE